MSSETTSKKTIWAIIATALLSFCGILSETSMNVTFSHLSEVFGLELGVLQWVTTAYLLAVAVTITTSATLKQNFKERHIFFASVAFFITGSLIAIASQQFGIMILGRVLQGMGTGVAMPLMFNIIAERIPRQKMGFYMGMGGLIMGLAPAFGPTYGGFMIARFDWQWIFIAILPVALLALIIGAIFIENSPASAEKRPFNWFDFILLAIALSSALLAVSSLEAGQLNWTYLLVFILALLAFIWRSSKEENPFLDIKLLTNPLILFGLLPFAIFQFSNLSANFVIPNFLTMSLGLGSSLAGFSLLPGTLIGTFTEPFFGKLYDDKGPRLSLYWGNAIFTLALVLLSFFTSSLLLWSITLIYIVFTIGRNMAFNNTMAAVMNEMPREKSADITAIFQMIQQFAGALGTAISAVVVDSAASVSQGSQYVFMILLVLVLANFLFYKIMFSHFKD
ncbi:MFS transporter [Streptococcus loxodontisalivarius]|uniref:EmrB/QacA subfamily drug resistance transporter n=1 Tax=Streptococcus loxodontisalivarius TaxID=1349415 RepID=A0ABS2PUP3_9STRE|nr:MFS transporter [Streptococcus loxodontisalivarius]MBM7643769.1 EmrB/QacA subfamily drug resistance transporter [Streptococcus loxodontisalivarius]